MNLTDIPQSHSPVDFLKYRRTYVFNKKLRLHIVSIYINLYQNRFINECTRKDFLRFSEGQRSYFVRCKRIYVLNK